MAKFDYYVSAVEYNSDKTHIAKLNIHKVGDDGKFNAQKATESTRPEVIELIKKGKTFSTIIKGKDGWSLGAPLQIIEVTTEYLKTKSDKSTKDNLENLPEV